MYIVKTERERGSVGTCRNWRFPFETMVGKKLKALVCGSHAGAALKEHTHTYTFAYRVLPFFFTGRKTTLTTFLVVGAKASRRGRRRVQLPVNC